MILICNCSFSMRIRWTIMSWELFKFQSSFGLRLCSMMRNPLCLDWHWGLLVYCVLYWLQRNASIHQGRLSSEEAMVKIIQWEVKNRVECNSYCNCSKQENTVFGGISCSVLQNSSSQWSLSPLTNRILRWTHAIVFLTVSLQGAREDIWI